MVPSSDVTSSAADSSILFSMLQTIAAARENVSVDIGFEA
jgi:hypothetical protein